MNNQRSNPKPRRKAFRPDSRRGVTAILAMMLLMLFGSLSAAMAIAGRGNISTAAVQLHTNRAHMAAETGMQVARERLADAAARFTVANSTMDATFVRAMWRGTTSGMGTYTTKPPRLGPLNLGAPTGIANALVQVHNKDTNAIPSLGVSTAVIGNAMAGVSSEYATTHWVYTPAVAIDAEAAAAKLAYSVTYAPLANGTDVRLIVTGYDMGYVRRGQVAQRTIMMDYRFDKRLRHAVVANSRVMLGKNVTVEGSMGSRFDAVTASNGDPIRIRSDFSGLDATLDTALSALRTALAASDIDGDNRLRVGHATEGLAIPPATVDTNGDGLTNAADVDVTGDGYVDEFDLFIARYDTNPRDGKVVLSNALKAGTPASGLASEFTVDDDLAFMMDTRNPDRNRNGISGWSDVNGNGRWDTGEVLLDYDAAKNVYRDRALGYRDGVIDKKDQYAKVSGSLAFKTTRAAWTDAQGPLSSRVQGPIRPAPGASATAFSVTDDELPPLDSSAFLSTQSGLQARADGQSFERQVATNLGIPPGQVKNYVETKPASSPLPRYLRLDPDDNDDGLPDNWQAAYYEKMPFNTPGFSDWYYRPVYHNMTFKDVQIDEGTNALFLNCTFVGVTYVKSTTDNTHRLWGEFGKMLMDTASGKPKEATPRTDYTGPNGSTRLPSTAKPPNKKVRIAGTPMDKGDILSNEEATTIGYNLLPDPLIRTGKRVVDTKPLSNNLRFHDCLFVGSIVSDAPQVYSQLRNKVQFTGSTRFLSAHPTSPNDSTLNPEDSDKTQISKSSMMMPGYSVDMGTFNSPPSQDIQLNGTIIAGVLDIRGSASIDGALLLTFNPTLGVPPLVDAGGNPMGNPAAFNSTIGYFGAADGDAEAVDPATLPIIGGQRIVGWDTNGDGLADVPSSQAQPTGSTAVAFNGYGRVSLRFKPTGMPDGVMLPLMAAPVPGSYREGKP
jgi:hypothetical protein